MSVYSMTGYGSASLGAAESAESTVGTAASVTVELRSVNGRYLDLSLRLPDELRGLEPALRELVAGQCKRGKIELRIATALDDDTGVPQPTSEQLNRLARVEGSVQAWLPKSAPLSVHEALQWCRGHAPAQRLDGQALEAARLAVQALREARAREGERLADVLRERCQALRQLATQAAPLIPAVVQRQQQRFLERWREALAASGAAQTIPARGACRSAP